MNRIQLIGLVNSEPTYVAALNQTKKMFFSLATREKYRGADGVNRENREVHNIVATGKTAELMRDHVRLNGKMLIEGKLVYNSSRPEISVNLFQTII